MLVFNDFFSWNPFYAAMKVIKKKLKSDISQKNIVLWETDKTFKLDLKGVFLRFFFKISVNLSSWNLELFSWSIYVNRKLSYNLYIDHKLLFSGTKPWNVGKAKIKMEVQKPSVIWWMIVSFQKFRPPKLEKGQNLGIFLLPSLFLLFTIKR